MNIEALLSTPAVQALGNALLHFLWQGALLAIALRFFNLLSRRAPAGARYTAACIVMLMMPAMLIATMLTGGTVSSQSVLSSSPQTLLPAAGRAAIRAVSDVVGIQTPYSAGLRGWAVFFWLVGIAGLPARSAAAWMAVQRLKRRTECASKEWIGTLERLKQQVRVSRPVQLFTSTIVKVPTVIGLLRPAILFPVSALAGLSEVQFEAILAH